MKNSLNKEEKWLIDRTQCITASESCNMFAKGKKVAAKKATKTKEAVEGYTIRFGKVAMTYAKMKAFQIREGDIVDEVFSNSMQFGKDNEPLAIEWLEDNCGMDTIVSGTQGEEISFRRFLESKGGDSADYFVLDPSGEEYAVGEIKCPYNKEKACELTDSNQVTKESVRGEYLWQLAQHLLANPHCGELHYTIYNAHSNRVTKAYYDRGLTFVFKREEFAEEIASLEYTLPKFHDFIMECVTYKAKAEDINDWWGDKGYA